MKTTGRTFGWILVAGYFLLPAAIQSQDSAYSRVGVYLFEPIKREGENERLKATSYGAGMPPGPGKFLQVFADANAPAVFLIAAFDKGYGSIHQKLKPVLIEKPKAFSEVSFPGKEKSALGFESDKKPFEIVVVVFEPSDARLAELKKLVSAIGKAESDEIFALQGAELKRRIDTWIRGKGRSEIKVPYAAPSVAAVRRAATGTPILWREHVYRKPLEESSPALFVFPVPAKPEAK